MKSITIQGKKRESVGKASTKALRDADLVPCVVYGVGEPIHFSAEEKAFNKLIYTADAHTVELVLDDGAVITAILQDVQFHPVTDRLLHADFYHYTEDKEISLEIPVKIVGNSPGVIAGGVLRKNMHKLRVKALPANLPDYIEVNISDLKIGHKRYIEHLKNEDYTFLHPDNAVVVAVRTSRVALLGDGAEDDDDEDEEETKEGDSEGGEG